MKKSKPTFFGKIVTVVALLFALGLICGALAGKIDPNKSILIAFIGLAYPFFLLANIIFVGWWLLHKKWGFALLTLIVILSGWHTLISTFGFFGNPGSEKKEQPELVRIMTYNVHNFTSYTNEKSVAVKQQMLNTVEEQNPDVVCFQEFFTRFRGPYDTIDSLKKVLKTKYFYFKPTQKSDSEAIGLAIFSKYPIKDQGVINFPNAEGNESILVDLLIDNQVVRVYNVHLQSISFDKQDYVYIDQVKEFDAGMGSTKRILHMLKSAFQKRSVQVNLMRAHMKTCTTPYILAGDFNDTPASYAVRKMLDSLNNAFIKKGQGLGKTYNGKFPNFQIDYIATTPDIEVTNYHIIETQISDHFPVRSDLRLNGSK